MDLTQYKLLILCTYRHFLGTVWLAYDQAFREHTAATHLSDWSSMNAQLFNFHTAGSLVHNSSLALSSEYLKPPVSCASSVVCISWNKGRYMAPFSACRYPHRARIVQPRADPSKDASDQCK